jgi:hypothetical protein
MLVASNSVDDPMRTLARQRRVNRPALVRPAGRRGLAARARRHSQKKPGLVGGASAKENSHPRKGRTHTIDQLPARTCCGFATLENNSFQGELSVKVSNRARAV